MISMTMSRSTATVQGTARDERDRGEHLHTAPHPTANMLIHSLQRPALSLILLTRSVCRSTRLDTRSVLSAMLSIRPGAGGKGVNREQDRKLVRARPQPQTKPTNLAVCLLPNGNAHLLLPPQSL